jgi:hypothetical protein
VIGSGVLSLVQVRGGIYISIVWEQAFSDQAAVCDFHVFP